VPNGYESWQEIGRIFDRFRDGEFKDFREETRDEIKWLRRLIIGTLVSAVLGSIASSLFVVITR
jgi:hypothetical protein